MASADDKKLLVKLARKGKLEGDDGFRNKLAELNRAGITGPGHDYGLDWSDKPFWRPALWEASWKNHDAIVRLLVEKGATVDFADYQGRTPLHEAAYYGYENLVEFFLEKGHPVDPKDNFGQTPLFRATEAGRDRIVELLVNRQANLNLLDSDGVTLQHVAAFEGMPDMSQWLLYKGAWKNRFAKEHAATEITGRSSVGIANALPKPTMMTEVDEAATEPPSSPPGTAAGVAVATPEAKDGADKAVAENTPKVSRSQFSD